MNLAGIEAGGMEAEAGGAICTTTTSAKEGKATSAAMSPAEAAAGFSNN